MNNKIAIAAVLILGSAAGGWWLGREYSPQPEHRHDLPGQTTAQGEVYYSCAMHPQVHQLEPGQCPICGMPLVERRASAAPTTTGASTMVTIDPRMAQNLGMRTATVTAGSNSSAITAVGSVMIDERRIVAVEARAAGWVEHLEVRAAGDAVQRGQVLAGVYSPDLLAAQEELELARKLGDAAMIEAARTRLNLLGVSENSKGVQRRVAITAPQSGVVTELLVRQGMQVTPGMPLMKLADLSTIWIVVEIPEAQAASLAPGRAAQARLPSLPGRLFSGTVDYVYPQLDLQTRTLRARITFDNADLALKPGMFAQVSLPGVGGDEVTLVPTEAVIRTGTRNVVLVAEGAGRYRPVQVQLGPEHEDQIVVVSGLRPGQQVLSSGQFLIDSEASLLGAYQRMGSADTTASPDGAAP